MGGGAANTVDGTVDGTSLNGTPNGSQGDGFRGGWLSAGQWLSVQRRLKVSPQQLRIMRAIIEQERIVKEIARDLGISPRSVTTQVERLYAKLQVRSHAGLTRRVFWEVLKMREEALD